MTEAVFKNKILVLIVPTVLKMNKFFLFFVFSKSKNEPSTKVKRAAESFVIGRKQRDVRDQSDLVSIGLLRLTTSTI